MKTRHFRNGEEMRYGIWLLSSVLMVTFAASLSCGKRGQGEREDISRRKVYVVATTGMIGDAAAVVGGERVEVATLMGPGVDPHLYKASEGAVTRMAGADIIFYNGLHLEGKMSEVFEKMGGYVRAVAIGGTIPGARLLRAEGSYGSPDPHIWFDVTLWIQAVGAMRDAYIELDPVHVDIYTANFRDYLADLADLHAYVIRRAGTVPEASRVLITAHDAFNYFGRQYGFEVRGLQGISTSSEAGTADVRALADFIVERSIPAIFVESSIPVRNVEAVKAAVQARGFNVGIGGELYSDALGTKGTAEGTYIGMVRHNIDIIVEAFRAE